MIEVEDKLEKAVHLVFLNDPRLAESAHDLQKRGAFFHFEVLNRYVRHVNDHNAVAQVGLVESNFSLVKFSPCLPYLRLRQLFFFLRYEILCFGVQVLLYLTHLDVRFCYFLKAFRDCLTVRKLVPYEVINSLERPPVSVVVDFCIFVKHSLLRPHVVPIVAQISCNKVFQIGQGLK